MKRCFTTVVTMGAVLAVASVSNATIIGFAGIGGNNTTIPASLGSNASVDAPGFTVSNGTTPNVALSWHSGWDIHTSGHFQALEDQTAGGTPWDIEGAGDRRIAQMEGDTIGFSVDSGSSLILNSFDIANTREDTDIAVWDIVLTDSGNNVAWSTQVTLDNNTGDDVTTVTSNYTGAAGEDYTLTFSQNGTSSDFGRNGIDNLSFNQVTVPEPATAGLLAMGSLLALGAYRRR